MAKETTVDFLEKTLEDIIYETDNDKLLKRGLPISGKKYRQIKIGNYGICDLITVQRIPGRSHINITVHELKKDKIDANTLMQAFRYRKGIKRFLEKRFKNKDVFLDIDVVLIGKSVCSGDFCYLLGEAYGFDTYNYSYDWDGITFERQYGYFLREEGFNV
jgi:hypothetical protein